MFGKEKTYEEVLKDMYDSDGTLHSTGAYYDHLERDRRDRVRMCFNDDD